MYKQCVLALKRCAHPFMAVLLVIIFIGYTSNIAAAISEAQKDVYDKGIRHFDVSPGGGTICSASGGGDTTDVPGGDNADIVWNYFKNKGLSDAQVAGIMGNMQQESGYDPLILQVGGRSKDPLDAKDLGWGIIQWSGNGTSGHSTADKFNKLYNDSGLTGKKYELLTQLDLVWHHMNNDPVVTQPFSLDDYKKITDPEQAALYFLVHIEGGTDPIDPHTGKGIREADARATFNDRKGTGGSVAISTSTGDSCVSSNTSPDCQTATGNAKILCEAKKYNVVDYVWGGGHAGGEAYHQACRNPVANSSACGLDCSGLVGVAVYDAFNNNASWTTYTVVSDHANWKSVSFEELQPGDVIEPNPDHIEIVDHVAGSTIFTFGAHTTHAPQPDQVGPAKYVQSGAYQYFTYVGEGASS